MADKQNQANDAPKGMRQVLVKHLDSPPPSGKTGTHPRRPAPIVPTREERTREQGDGDANPEEFPHE
jgi:hypothetical protein